MFRVINEILLEINMKAYERNKKAKKKKKG